MLPFKPVLEDMPRVFKFVNCYENVFVDLKLMNNEQNKKKEFTKKRKEFEKAEKRIAEIDNIILSLYEDKALGNITDERYTNMSAKLETEQRELTALLDNLEQELTTEKTKIDNVHAFVENVKK